MSIISESLPVTKIQQKGGTKLLENVEGYVVIRRGADDLGIFLGEAMSKLLVQNGILQEYEEYLYEINTSEIVETVHKARKREYDHNTVEFDRNLFQ